jgi:hypothetical protein
LFKTHLRILQGIFLEILSPLKKSHAMFLPTLTYIILNQTINDSFLTTCNFNQNKNHILII